MEQFKSFSFSTLNGAINSSQTTITVLSAAGFPATGTFRIIVDSEIIRVDSISGNVFTVTRGADLSTPASHSSGAGVNYVFTGGSIAQYAVDTLDRDTWANGVSAADGRLLLPTDSPIIRMDTNGSLVGMGDLYKQVLPILANFTWANQGTATADDSKGAVLLWDTTTQQWRHLRKAMPTPPFTIKVRLIAHTYPTNYNKVAIGFYESATGKFETIENIYASGFCWEQNKWNSITSYNSTRNRHFPYRGQAQHIEWFSLRHDGTTLYYGLGIDAWNFWEYSSASKTDFFTSGPDQVFFGMNLDGTASNQGPGGGTFYHWEEIT